VQSQSLEIKKQDPSNKSLKKKLKKKNSKLKKAAALTTDSKVNSSIAEEILSAVTLDEFHEKAKNHSSSIQKDPSMSLNKSSSNFSTEHQIPSSKRNESSASISPSSSIPLRLSKAINLDDPFQDNRNGINIKSAEKLKNDKFNKPIELEIEKEKEKAPGPIKKISFSEPVKKPQEAEEVEEEDPVLDVTDIVNFFFVFISIMLFFSTLVHHNIHGFSVSELSMND
jgi:hypothetical protein